MYLIGSLADNRFLLLRAPPLPLPRQLFPLHNPFAKASYPGARTRDLGNSRGFNFHLSGFGLREGLRVSEQSNK
ncbi:hypothetical protein SUGI_1098320 [Cryptomeria japonica]|nr:hypothetical protein SUGI_1098320 [Cryptomeria japonica]